MQSIMLASDFSGIIWDALAILGGIAIACLAGGAITAGVVVLLTNQRKYWWLTLPFAAMWFAFGWVVATQFGF